jgi:adenylosuccinate synthase
MARVVEAPYLFQGDITHATCTQWGDTAKGKTVNAGAQYYDIVVKTNGGANAGHTVEKDGKTYKFNLLPSSIIEPGVLSVIGSNVVVDPLQLEKESMNLRERGQDVSPENLAISHNATVVFEWHKVQDGLRERIRSNNPIGTTGRGIGPAYAERTGRTDLRIKDLIAPNFEKKFREKAEEQARLTRFLAGERLEYDMGVETTEQMIRTDKILREIQDRLDPDQMLEKLMQAREFLAPMVTNTLELFQNAQQKSMRILGEAGQGALLDLDFGMSPYVTSSHPGVVGFTLSTGIQPRDVDRVIGTAKAYMTRVGEGPMPTEQLNEIGEELQREGREIGTTTGRTRRTGWFDAVATKYGIDHATGVTEVVLTKLDVLDNFDSINIANAYNVNGRRVTELTDPDEMVQAEPIYETLEGWNEPITEVRAYEDLPENARRYVERIEEVIDTPITAISVGPAQDAIIYRNAA